MRIKIYVITEVLDTGVERYIAARLTYEAARSIAKLGGNRKITKTYATKSNSLEVH